MVYGVLGKWFSHFREFIEDNDGVTAFINKKFIYLSILNIPKKHTDTIMILSDNVGCKCVCTLYSIAMYSMLAVNVFVHCTV